jgi:hypothetical protein
LLDGDVVESTPAFKPYMPVRDVENILAHLERPFYESWVENPAGGLEAKIALVLIGGYLQNEWPTVEEVLGGYQSLKKHLREREKFPEDISTPAGAYWAAVSRNAYYRALFRTNDGQLGLGPRCTQPGDIVAILYGSTLPMVMRPLPEQRGYKLLATSYVYGVMGGEAVPRHRAMGEKDFVFRIV